MDEKLQEIKEAIQDWKLGKLSAYAAMVAINMILNEARPPTEKEVEYGLGLERLAKESLTATSSDTAISGFFICRENK